MGLFDCGHTHMAAHSLSPDVPFVSCSNIKRRSAYTIIIILAAAFHFFLAVCEQVLFQLPPNSHSACLNRNCVQVGRSMESF